MEEVAVAEPAGRSLSSSLCGYGYGCEEDKSRAARRRRMEIRRFKMLANAACNKRIRLSRHHGAVAAASYCNDQEEEEDEDENGSATDSVKDRQVTEKEEKVTQSLPSSEGFVSALPSTSLGLASVDGDGDQCPPYGLVSICGGRREMEDALRVVPALGCGADGVYHFFGVYDGHGGPQAAFYCKQRLHEALADEIRLTDPKTEKEWKAVMKACFLKMDVEVAGLCGTKHLKTSPGCPGIESRGEDVRQEPAATKTAPETVGSTAVVAVVGSRQIVVANCGDSRAVLSRGGRVIPLSTDHKPELAEEMARIEAAGGRVIYWNGYRVFGVLAMSRAIGDKYLKPYVIAEPELSFTARTAEDECLILASDGLWDVLSNEVVCEISRKCLALRGRNEHVEGERDGTGGRRGGESGFESPAATAAALLTKLALARGSADNISVVVVDLRRPLSSPSI